MTRKTPVAPDAVAVILAAGQGTRMRSTIPKVLHPLCGEPMLEHVIAAIEEAGLERRVTVIGHGQDMIEQHFGARTEYAIQAERLGTAHAVKVTEPLLKGFKGDVLICCGDTPLLRAETLANLVKRRRQTKAAAIVLTANLDNPHGYGRILRDNLGRVLRIVEQRDCKPEEAAIREVNTGVYCVDAKLLFQALKRVDNNNAQREYYLPDIIPILAGDGHKVEGLLTEDPSEMVGVNSRQQLAHAGSVMRKRLLDQMMDAGVSIVDPDTTFVHRQVRVGRDSIIHPFTTLKGRTIIGEGCDVGPSAHLSDAKVGDACKIGQCTITDSEVGDGVDIGPYAILREGTRLGDRSRLMGFVDLTGCTVEPEAIIEPHRHFVRCTIGGGGPQAATVRANGHAPAEANH